MVQGSTYQIRAKYLLGCDGSRSVVARDIGLPTEGQTVSTLDLAGKGRFTLFTDIGGGAEVSMHTGVEIASFVIGPGREALDIYDDWARTREMSESSCVLVRPDGHVAWRQDAARNCNVELAGAMQQIPGRQ